LQIFHSLEFSEEGTRRRRRRRRRKREGRRGRLVGMIFN